ncbi:uncharacterized protein PHALS_03044 [Plasmopara halstedii]|uniref:Uncharacterized protein n=1 Tax=Plasmopara halstedii TaxID=4781 RepID=A0A0P1A8A1_PLAHL|nr:uncharacterized protein PHALS_03044 [Plasmopara halstedii]CEG36496.1 hypothetical protein PHALS_03044 [Plasmopara halstedii]|eukprot:XP_024572865.1 hypothetical protein PHALS_03044 [Plasmopara halstedii]
MLDMKDDWTSKPWGVTEEMWRRKAKSLEDQYQQLLSDHQDLRLEKAKMMGELRVLQRYKETTEDAMSREVASRKTEYKNKVAATTKLEQCMKKYERECEKVYTLERENTFLMEQISNVKGETEKRLDLLKELEDSQKRYARLKEKLREMEVVSIEHENTILELKEKNHKLKRNAARAEEEAAEKSEEVKNIAVRLAAVESAWEAARGQNKTALHELKKKESLSKELENVKSETKHASHRIHALDVEVETAQSKLRQKDRAIEELRDKNAHLTKELARLTARMDDLSATLKATRKLIDEKDAEIERKTEQLRSKKTEVKTLERIDDSSKDRIEDLVCQVSELQQELFDAQKEYLRKVNKDELMREKQLARDRAEISKELETTHKPRRCKNCNETYTNKSNTSLSCSYHPVMNNLGQELAPEQRIVDVCKDNEKLTIQLQQAVSVNEVGTPQFTEWTINAFFPSQKRLDTKDVQADIEAIPRTILTPKVPISETKLKEDEISSSADDLKEYVHAEMLHQVKSRQFLSDMEMEAAFLYEWNRIHFEEIDQESCEREIVQKLLLSCFNKLNAAYMHYAVGSSEVTYGMNGAEFAHFLHECEIAKVHDENAQNHTSSRDSFSSRTLILPTITRLTSGPFRDHLHQNRLVVFIQEAKPKLIKVYAKYALEYAPKRKTNDHHKVGETSLGRPISSTWPLLLSVVGLKSMLYDCGMFCSGTLEEQTALFDRAVDQSFSGCREEQSVVFCEFLEIIARVALNMLGDENDLPPRDIIKLAVEAVRSLPLK